MSFIDSDSVGVDIGATNARIALISKDGEILNTRVYKMKRDTAENPALSLREALADYKECHDLWENIPLIIGSAAHRDADGIWRFTHNKDAEIDIAALQDDGWIIEDNKEYMRGDLDVAAWGSIDSIEISPEKIGKNLRMMVISVGSGIGHSLLTYNSKHNEWDVIASHGGWTAAARTRDTGHVPDDFSAFLKPYIKPAQLEANDGFIIWEDILCGDGLYHTYLALHDMAQQNVESLTERFNGRALKDRYATKNDFFHNLDDADDPIMREALHIFHVLLALHAKNIAVNAIAYDGIFYCGGVMDTLREKNLFDETLFRAHFATGVKCITDDLEMPIIFADRDVPVGLIGIRNMLDARKQDTLEPAFYGPIALDERVHS